MIYSPNDTWEKTDCGWNYNTGYCYGTPRAADTRKALKPLLDHITSYDAQRQKLETEGGGISDFARVTQHLTHPIVLKGNYGDCKVSLADQASIRTALLDVGNSDLHVDIRQLSTGMPVYYLCRVRRDYWSEYSLIVEDLYQSAGYPMADERFVRMMDCGHETYYLRLSQFRDKLEEEEHRVRKLRCTHGRSAAGATNPLSEGEGEDERKSSRLIAPTVLREEYSGDFRLRSEAPARQDEPAASSDIQTDDTLYHAGRHVFQAAWHEDQRPGVLTAAHFNLPHFRQAIELLYLCLSGELCELRNATNESLLSFFETTYPQPAIHAFLGLLSGLDGAAINDMPKKGLKLYARLSSAFSRFLSVEVPWGHRQASMPLYKLVFGNFSRLALVAGRLKEDPRIRDAILRLEQESQSIVAEIAAK